MGITGPPPKPGRARRNADTFTPEHELPADGRAGDIPEPLVDLGPLAREWWDEVWRSPVATQWHSVADRGALTRLASLIGWMWSDDPDVARLAPLPEIRQLEDRFGLSPEARKKLRWEIVDDDGAGAGMKKPKVRAKVEQTGGDARSILHAV